MHLGVSSSSGFGLHAHASISVDPCVAILNHFRPTALVAQWWELQSGLGDCQLQKVRCIVLNEPGVRIAIRVKHRAFRSCM